MIVYVNGGRYFRVIKPKGGHPDNECRHYLLWQPVQWSRGWFSKGWKDAGQPFWLDDDGFIPMPGID